VSPPGPVEFLLPRDPPADVTVERIDDRLRYDLPATCDAGSAGRTTAASALIVGEKP
jgi:hypothetical protein